MNFSLRTSWHRQPNQLTELLETRRANGLPVFDLTISNPTECGFVYPEREILTALANAESLKYQPDAKGLLSAREAVAEYYKTKNIVVDPSNIILTASTSEAYSFVFKLLCNAGESALVPKPSYPLFEYLARVNDVELQRYRLLYDHGWNIDIESMRQSLTDTTKAIVIINPHNPTGMFLKQHEYDAIKKLARTHNLALIVDEVFNEYAFDQTTEIFPTAGESDVLTFTLNGISKMCALPQMKLGWSVVTGHSSLVQEACERLEILTDTFLSVNTPVQVALPALLQAGVSARQQIQERTKNNYRWLANRLKTRNSNPEPVSAYPISHISHLTTESGWATILRVPAIKTDEEWAMELLDKKGIFVYPGYFFDFEREGYLVVSLLVEEQKFHHAMDSLITYIDSNS